MTEWERLLDSASEPSMPTMEWSDHTTRNGYITQLTSWSAFLEDRSWRPTLQSHAQ